MSFIHYYQIGFFASWTAGEPPRVVKALNGDDILTIERAVAAQYNRVVKLEDYLSPDGALRLGCSGPDDFDEAKFVAVAAYDSLGTTAGEKGPFSPAELLLSVRHILARDGLVKRIRAVTDAGTRVKEVVRAIRAENSLDCLSWPHAIRAVRPLDGGAVPALTVALCDESENVRRFAGEALAECGPTAVDAVDALIGALGDSSRTVRIGAAEALAAIGPAAAPAIKTLTDLLVTNDAGVTRVVAEALRRIGRSAMPTLISLIEHDDWYVRLFAIAELKPSDVDVSEWIPVLADRAQDASERIEVRLEAKRVIRAIKNRRAE